MAEDAENTLDGLTNHHFNCQRNTGASQAKCFMRETHYGVFWTCDRERSRKKDILFSKTRCKKGRGRPPTKWSYMNKVPISSKARVASQAWDRMIDDTHF